MADTPKKLTFLPPSFDHGDPALELLKKEFLQLNRYRTENMQTLGIILRIAELVATSADDKDLGQAIIDIFIHDTNFENASLLLYHKKTDALRLHAAKGFWEFLDSEQERTINRTLIFHRGEGIAWSVFESQTPVFIEDCLKNPLPTKPGATIRPGCLACLPVAGIGVLNLSSSSPRKFLPHQRRDLVILSNILGQLLKTGKVHEKLNISHHHLQDVVEAQTRELQHVNQELQTAMAYMESVVQNVPQGICLLDPEGLISYANPGLLAMMRCAQVDIAGQSPATFFQDPIEFDRLERALAEQGVVQVSDVTIRRFDGSVCPADLFLHPVGGPGEHIQGSMLVFHDLTGQKTKTEQWLQSEKLTALGSMACGVAHDFNNLLAAILGNVEVLGTRITDPWAMDKLKKIELAVQDGAHTVRRLQTFSQAGGGDRRASASFTDLNEAVRDAIELTRPRWKNNFQKNGLTVHIHLDLKPVAKVALHKAELREILVNLIFNALDAMPQGGSIWIRTDQTDTTVTLVFTDSGVGIPHPIRHRIFDPFFTTKGVGNSGLGLCVSYGLVTRAEGRMQVESEEGRGATFTITLPAAEGGEPVQEAVSRETCAPDLKILVVDDEEQIVELITTMLEGVGHRALGLTDSLQAMECLKDRSFDLILTDLGMPGVSGWEIASEVKKKNSETPVILLTGWGAEYEGQDLKDRGVDAVLGKPFKLNQLLETISRLL